MCVSRPAADAVIVVTADHGQVHLFPESWIEIDELHPMISAQAGEMVGVDKEERLTTPLRSMRKSVAACTSWPVRNDPVNEVWPESPLSST